MKTPPKTPTLLQRLNAIEGKMTPIERRIHEYEQLKRSAQRSYNLAVACRNKAEVSKFGRALCDAAKAIAHELELLAPLQRLYKHVQAYMQGKPVPMPVFA